MLGSNLFQGGGREFLQLPWSKLADLSINDNGSYQIAFRAEDEEGISEAFFHFFDPQRSPNGTSSRSGTTRFRSSRWSRRRQIGVPYRIFFNANDPGDDRPSEWSVDWGDGTTLVYGSGTRSATHAYLAPGDFNIGVSEVDEDSAPNAYPAVVKQVRVSLDPTSANVFGGPFSVVQGSSLVLAEVRPEIQPG